MITSEAQAEPLTYYVISRSPGHATNLGEVTATSVEDAQTQAEGLFGAAAVEVILSYQDQIVEFDVYRTWMVNEKIHLETIGIFDARRKTDIRQYVIDHGLAAQDQKDSIGFTIKDPVDRLSGIEAD